MKPRPLPIRVRYCTGETVSSYAARVATANGTTAAKQEHIAYLNGWITSRARNSPERTRLWETLAGLPPGAIPQPPTTGLDKHQPHPLCIKCTQGIPVLGWLTSSGVVCLRHRIAHAHTVLPTTIEQIRAERTYRQYLAPAGLHPHHRIVAAAHNIALFANQQQDNRAPDSALHLLTHYAETVDTAITLLNQRPARQHEPRPRLLRAS